MPIFRTAAVTGLVSLLLLGRVHARIKKETLTKDELRIIRQFDVDTLAYNDLLNSHTVGEFLHKTSQRRKSSPKPGGTKGKGKRIKETQTVFLDFDYMYDFYPVIVYDVQGSYCYTEAFPRREYTQELRNAIKERIETDYKEFNFYFTTDRPHPFEGEYSTLRFYYEGEGRFPDPYFFEPFQLTVPNCTSDADAFVNFTDFNVVSSPGLSVSARVR